MEKTITYFSSKCIVKCDEKCNKAWGISNRPTLQLDEDDDDDFCYLSDDELSHAPIDPGTYEGGDAKPENMLDVPNKWCVRECERCEMGNSGQPSSEIILPDFSKRIYNKPSKHIN